MQDYKFMLALVWVFMTLHIVGGTSALVRFFSPRGGNRNKIH